MTEKVGIIQPREEKAPGKSCSLSVLEVAPTRKIGTNLLARPVVIGQRVMVSN